MKQVTDLLDVQVSMDDEDRELMRMFPRSRQTVLNEMLFVQDKSGAYLVKKSDVTRWKNVLHGMVTAVRVALCSLFLVCSFLSFVMGIGNPSLYLFAFEVMLIPLLLKIPSEVAK
ncbi:MAG: hypothetical protein Q4F81_03705 [Eubacteriales bacterium]|nr:hypothetical protein [Eubacteriales bacterium]